MQNPRINASDGSECGHQLLISWNDVTWMLSYDKFLWSSPQTKRTVKWKYWTDEATTIVIWSFSCMWTSNSKNEYSNPPLSSVYPTVTVPLISTLHLLQTNASSLFIFPFSYPPNFTSFDVLFGLPWVWHLRSQAQIHTFLNPIIASCHPFVMHHHTVITFYVAIQRQYPVALTSLSFQHNLWNSWKQIHSFGEWDETQIQQYDDANNRYHAVETCQFSIPWKLSIQTP